MDTEHTYNEMAYRVPWHIPDQSRPNKNGNICLKIVRIISQSQNIFQIKTQFDSGNCMPPLHSYCDYKLLKYTYSVCKS